MTNFQNEIEFFDRHAEALLNADCKELIVDKPHKHLAGSTIAFDYMMGRLGDLTGKTILDVGCGCGWFSVYLIQQGAKRVYGIDISPKMIDVAKKRAQINKVEDRVRFESKVAEEMQISEIFFDLIVGISVLHHIDLATFGNSMKKILKEDGKAFFIEPLGENKLITFVRDKVHSGIFGIRTEEEKPLTFQAINVLKNFFIIQAQEFQLFGSIARYIGETITSMLGLDALDRFLFKLVPSLKKQCRLVVIELTPQKRT